MFPRAFVAPFLTIIIALFALPAALCAQSATEYMLTDDETGGACTTIGEWDARYNTCTLTVDVTGDIVLATSTLHLDGGDFTVTGSITANGHEWLHMENVNVLEGKIGVYNGAHIYIHDVSVEGHQNVIRCIELANVDHAVVEENLTRNCYMGIDSHDGSHNIIARNEIIGYRTGVDPSYTGIFLSSAASKVHDNTISKSNQFGLLSQQEGSVLTRNTISETRWGLGVAHLKHRNKVIGNRTSDTDDVGISIGGGNSIVAGNLVENGLHGIELNHLNNTARYNTIQNNWGNGIELGDGRNREGFHVVHDNLIKKNTRDPQNSGWGAVTLYTSDNEIFNNTIEDNWNGVRVNNISAEFQSFYNNNIIDNDQDVVSGKHRRLRDASKPLPDGGNYWSTYDTAVEGCVDELDNATGATSSDMICDEPMVRPLVTDELPWTVRDGWRVVEENTRPVVQLIGSDTVIVNVGDIYLDDGAIATDDEDGDISDTLIKTGYVDHLRPSSYTITYTAYDERGEFAQDVTRTVIVKDPNVNTVPKPSYYIALALMIMFLMKMHQLLIKYRLQGSLTK